MHMCMTVSVYQAVLLEQEPGYEARCLFYWVLFVVVVKGASCTAVSGGCDCLHNVATIGDEDDPLLDLSDSETTYDVPEEDIPQETSSSNVSNTHRGLPERCVETIKFEHAQQQLEYSYEAKPNIPK